MKRCISPEDTRVLRSRSIGVTSRTGLSLNKPQLASSSSSAAKARQPALNSNKGKVEVTSPAIDDEIHIGLEESKEHGRISPIDGIINGKGKIFRSVLALGDIIDDDYSTGSPKGLRPVLLRRALSIQELGDDSWLSSSLIDLVISKFSKTYTSCHFMSIDFVVLSLSSKNMADYHTITDISGNPINYNEDTPIVFCCNSFDIHWNLVRVVRGANPALELFEPMGKPINRHGGLGSRDVPRCVIDWLNACCPLADGKSWITVGVSAITLRQQLNHFDCGVAVLLYAEKCGQGLSTEDINTDTSQENISAYRRMLQDFTRRVENLP